MEMYAPSVTSGCVMKMKGSIFVLVALFGSLSGYGQNPPPSTISQPAPATPDTNQSSHPSATNLLSQSNLTFTNSAGTVFSVDQLAGQLQNLRQAVEQTLPMLTAFTQTLLECGHCWQRDVGWGDLRNLIGCSETGYQCRGVRPGIVSENQFNGCLAAIADHECSGIHACQPWHIPGFNRFAEAVGTNSTPA